LTQSAFDEGERRRFVADPDVLAALDMRADDLADPDARSYVIRQEHPEFDDAFHEGLEEVDLGYGPINTRLHLAMHEIVATQLWDGDPPEVWETALRLRDDGYERHEVLHMLGRTMSDQIWAAFHDEQPYDRERHIAELRALPGSWERERSALGATRRHAEPPKRTRRAAGTARRRNRRRR
jgi:hypothetical protein